MNQALADAYALLKTGTLWHNTQLASPKHPCKGFADANPGEAAQIDAYVDAVVAGRAASAPVLQTATGRGLVGMLAALAPAPPPPPASGMPRQGISSPEFINRSSADQDYELDRVKELGNGHPMFFRFDWWPNMDSQFAAARLKMEARGIVPMPLLNYDPGNRPNAAAFAAQAVMCAQTFSWVNLLNEPNLGGWTPQDAAVYVRQAYAAVGGKAKILAPDVATNSSHPPASVVAWVQAYMAAGGKQDIAAVNLYTDSEQLDPGWNLWAEVPALKAAFGPVPLVSLEGGCKVDGQTYGTKWGQLTGVQYQDKSVATGMAARAAGTIDSYLVYSVFNSFKNAAGGFGLLDSSRVKRPAYGTFQAHAA